METATPCPRCGGALGPGSVAVAQWQCARCNGCWVSPDELAPLLLELGLDKDVLRAMADHFPGEGMLCPACQRVMAGARIKGVMLDVCHGCGGCWVDGGELGALTGGRHANPARLKALPAPAARQRRRDLVLPLHGPPIRRSMVESVFIGALTLAVLATTATVYSRWMVVWAVAALLGWLLSASRVRVRLSQRMVEVCHTFAGISLWKKELAVNGAARLDVVSKVMTDSDGAVLRTRWHLMLRAAAGEAKVGVFVEAGDAHQRALELAKVLDLPAPEVIST